MTDDELFKLHEDLCSEARELMRAKNQDYRGGDRIDPFKNFKGSLIFDVEPEIGTMIRMNDKFQRVKAFIDNGTLAIQSEGIRDIGKDLINYTVLLVGQLIDRMSEKETDLVTAIDPTGRLNAHIRRIAILSDDAMSTKFIDVPDGYSILDPNDTIASNDIWLCGITLKWENVPQDSFFVGTFKQASARWAARTDRPRINLYIARRT